MSSYSYEIDLPEDDEPDAGRRYSYGDHFTSRKEATLAMKEDIKDAPVGSTAIVYIRDENGDICNERKYVKRVVVSRSV